MRLIKLPGEPAMMVLAHSVVILGAVFGEAEIVDKASSIGDATTGFPSSGEGEGLISGVLAGGDEVSEAVLLLEAALPSP